MSYFYYNMSDKEKVQVLMMSEFSIIEYCPNDIANLIKKLRAQKNDADADLVEGRFISTAGKAAEIGKEITYFRSLSKNTTEVGRLTDSEYKKVLQRISLIPERVHNRSHCTKELIVQARTSGIIHHRQQAIPRSETVHVGVRGKISVEWMREIEDIIGRKWTTIPRIPILRNRRKPDYAALMRHAYSSDGSGPCHGMDITDATHREQSTSILCSHTSLTKLILHDLVVFHSYVEPDFEKCMREAVAIPEL